MNEELELLKLVATRLDKAGIQYMMTGSMAMAVYSVPRMTRDIDMVVEIPTGGVPAIVSLFDSQFYIDADAVKQAVRDQSMFNVIHNESAIKVDFIVRKNAAYRVTEFSRRRKLVIDGISVWVAAPEDLLLSKLVWAKESESELQMRDARQILGSHTEMDMEYVKQWSEKLGLTELLSELIDNA